MWIIHVPFQCAKLASFCLRFKMLVLGMYVFYLSSLRSEPPET